MLLLAPPQSREVTAKLANFSKAKLDVRDKAVFVHDCRAFGVFVYNLSVKDLCDLCVTPVDVISKNQLNLRKDRGWGHLGLLVHALVSGQVSLASEADERLAVLMEELSHQSEHSCFFDPGGRG